MSRIERKRNAPSGSKSGRRTFKAWFKSLPTWKKVVMLAGTFLILAVLIVAIVAYAYLHGIVSDMHEDTPENYDLSLVDVDGYINILLLGVDSRDMSNIDGTRSDAIMIVSINEETNDVKVISVYRDTFLKMGDTESYDKITHACVYGGPEMTMKTLNQVMDLNISNYVVVNFKAVADLVDAVGGITVNVEDYEIEQLNKYTIETAENIGREDYQLVESAGSQTLEGVQAVSYGRIRKGVGDDFKRTERMRTVLTLVFNKMKTMSFSEIRDLIDLMTPQVRTNLSTNDVLALGFRLPGFTIAGSVGWPYDVTSGYINGVSYVFPNDLEANTIQLHQEVFGQSDYVASAVVSAISAEIAARIQSARDNQEIEGEQPVDIDTSNDPTQVTDPDNSGDNTGSGGGETTDPGGSGDGDTGTGGGSDTGDSGGSGTTDPGGSGDGDTGTGGGSGTGGSGGSGTTDPGGSGDGNTGSGGSGTGGSGGTGSGDTGNQGGNTGNTGNSTTG